MCIVDGMYLIYVRTYVCMWVCMYVYMYVYIYVCMYVRMSVLCILWVFVDVVYVYSR